MCRHHQALLLLEQEVANAKANAPLLDALSVVMTPAVRLMLLLFEQDSYRSSSPGGLHMLKGLLLTMPDSKLIEDVHALIRNDGKSQKTRTQTLHHIQEIVTQGNQFSTRQVPHQPHVDRDIFLTRFPHTRDRKRKRTGTPNHVMWKLVHVKHEFNCVFSSLDLFGCPAAPFVCQEVLCPEPHFA